MSGGGVRFRVCEMSPVVGNLQHEFGIPLKPYSGFGRKQGSRNRALREEDVLSS